MRRREALACIGSITVGGCLRFSSDGGASPGQPTGTAATSDAPSPTGVPTTQPTASAPTTTGTPSYPNGLSADGVSEFLFPSHVRTLSATSFRSRWSKLDVADSFLKWQKQYRADPQAALGTWSRIDGGPVEIYRTAGDGYWRESLGDRVTFGNDGTHRRTRLSSWAVEIAPLVRAAEWGPPTRANSARPATWEVSATGIADASAVPGHHVPGEVLAIHDASLTVDERGIIRSATAEYRIREGMDGEEFDYSIEFTVDSIGRESVAEPDWLPTAESSVPVVSASVTDDRRFVRFLIESGNRLEPNSRISVFNTDRDAKFIVPLDEPVEPGTPAYLSTPTPEASFSEGDIARGSPPDDVTAGTLPGSYEVAAFRRDTRYFDRVTVV